MADTEIPSTPSPVGLRAELEALLVAELHGPVGGEREQIAEGTVRDRYLVGSLAPLGTVSVDPERQVDPGVDGDDAIDEPEVEQAAARPALHPSSIGFTCVVLRDVERVVIEASWGRYAREKPETEGNGGASSARGRLWQRYPTSGRVEVRMADGPVGPLTVTPDQPEVVVRGVVSAQGAGWLVSVFLVNEQEPRDTLRDEAWLFQTKLS